MLTKLFRAPRLYDPHATRVATWLELFFDLVYVAAFVQLGNHLSDNVSIDGFIYFVVLFVPIWWSWHSATAFANRFESDDVEHRLFVFGQIGSVALMAIFAYDALGSTSAAFAVAYAVNRLIMMLLYMRADHAIPEARSLTRTHVVGYGIVMILWFVSAFVPTPLRFVLWAIGFVVDFGTPLIRANKHYEQFPPHEHHKSERLALLTIIVFGETFLKVIGGLAVGLQGGDIKLPLHEILFNISGLLVAFSLWWVYFENVAGRHLENTNRQFIAWVYTHLPYHLTIVAMGVGLYKLMIPASYYLVPDSYKWLLGGTVAASLVTIGIIEQMVQAHEEDSNDWHDLVIRLMGAAIVVAIAYVSVATEVSAALFLFLLTIPCIGQVFYDMYVRSTDVSASPFVEPTIDAAD